MSDLIIPGTATPSQVLTGQTFSSGSNYNVAGTMPNEGAVTLTPSGTGPVSIPAGYHNGSGQVSQVSVPAGNVLTGTTIAGVAGTMPNQGSPSWVPGPSNILLPAGYYSGGTIQGDANLVAANIISGKSIFGVSGSAPNVDKTNGGSVVYFWGAGYAWSFLPLSGTVSWSNVSYCLVFNNNSSTGQQALAYTNSMIDVTGWKYVVVMAHDMFDTLGILVSKTQNDTSNSAGATTVSSNIGPSDAAPNKSNIFYADVSALSGQYYIKLLGTTVGTSYGGGNFYAVILMNSVL